MLNLEVCCARSISGLKAGAIQADVNNLFNKYSDSKLEDEQIEDDILNNPNSNFLTFKSCWQDFQLSKLHFMIKKEEQIREFYQIIYGNILALASVDTEFVIYFLYTMVRTTPWKQRICIPISQPNFNFLVRRQRLEASSGSVYSKCFKFLMLAEAFDFNVTSGVTSIIINEKFMVYQRKLSTTVVQHFQEVHQGVFDTKPIAFVQLSSLKNQAQETDNFLSKASILNCQHQHVSHQVINELQQATSLYSFYQPMQDYYLPTKQFILPEKKYEENQEEILIPTKMEEQNKRTLPYFEISKREIPENIFKIQKVSEQDKPCVIQIKTGDFDDNKSTKSNNSLIQLPMFKVEKYSPVKIQIPQFYQ